MISDAAAVRLVDELQALRRVRISGTEVMSCWDRAAPDLRGDPDQHLRLARALEALERGGAIELPAAASWDRSYRPALPKFVTVPSSRRAARPQPWRTFPWRTELGWAASLRSLSDPQFTALVAINDWLGDAADRRIVPARIRSAELFGDEKAIDALVTSSLWGPDRLTWHLLAAQRVPLPLVVRRVGPGPEILVVENVDPFWLCLQVLEGTDCPVGRVAWGAGKAFESSVAALTAESEPPTRLWYWGDADPEGIRIPTAAALTAHRAGLPPLEPHPQLWEAYAPMRVQAAGTLEWGSVPTFWLGEALFRCLDGARSAGGRIAQEALGYTKVTQALLP